MMNVTEKIFLKEYDAELYVKPSVAVDIAAFSIFSQEEENYRKLPLQTLNILLIKRGEHPYQHTWALPGGFVQPKETAEETAMRELSEETGLNDIYMEQLYTFSEVGRDPRTRVMSVAYLALMVNEQQIMASTDAIQAAWFQVRLQEIGVEDVMGEGGRVKKTRYQLTLINKEEVIEAKILCEEVFSTHNYQKSYQVESSAGIAFDHSKIITFAIERLRGKIEYTDLGFYLLPEYFTLTTLQKIYEVILDKPLLAANFRRKLLDKVEETPHIAEGGGYRKAKLYKRKF